MKRAIALLALAMFAAPALRAQDNPAPAPEQPVPAPEAPAEPAKPAEPAEPGEPAKPERGNARTDRRAFAELGRVLREKDKDQDRKLSKEELGNDALFDKLDADKDGFVTLQEMLPGKDELIAELEKADKAAAEEEFKALDRDDNSKLSAEELGEERKAMLDTGDTDKDGSLSLEEWTKARAAAKAPKEGEGRQPRGMAELDKDGDGKLSKDEAPERLKGAFETLDKDGDGFLSQEELAGAMRGRRGRRGQQPGEQPAQPPAEPPKDGEKPKEGEKEDEF